MIVSKSKIKSGDLLETLKFVFLLDEQSFKKSFEKFGFSVNTEDDLKMLAALHESGKDKSGAVKVNGNPIYFDVKSIVHGINISNKRAYQNKPLVLSKLVD